MMLARELRTHVIAFVVAFGLFGPVLFLLFDREPPYDRIVGSISPENPEPGSAIETSWRIRTNRTCEPAKDRNVTRQIIDSHNVVYTFDEVPSVYGRNVTAQDSPSSIVRVFALPMNIAPGPARYRSRACFACNPLQHLWPICIDRPDIEFNIGTPPPRGPR